MTPASPLPWRVLCGDHNVNELTDVIDAQNHIVTSAYLGDESEVVNAHFIVTACNHHQRLIDALKALIDNRGCCDGDCCQAAFDQTAAIDNARAVIRDLDVSHGR